MNKEMRLSEHFTLGELCKTSVKAENVPGEKEVETLMIGLLAESAAFTLVELAAESLLYQMVQTVAQGYELHVVDDFVDEGVLQQQASLLQ